MVIVVGRPSQLSETCINLGKDLAWEPHIGAGPDTGLAYCACQIGILSEEIQTIGDGIPSCLNEDIIKDRRYRVFVCRNIFILLVQIEEVQSIFTFAASPSLPCNRCGIILPIMIYIHIKICQAGSTAYELYCKITVFRI